MSAGTKADQIRALAKTRVHKLSPDMADGRCGRKDLSDEAADGVLAYLSRCPEIKAAPGKIPVPASASAALREPGPHAPKDVPPGLGAFRGIPGGYYATPREGSEVIDFWLVEKETKPGQWNGFVFCRRVLGGPPNNPAKKLRSEKLANTMQQRIAMQAITEFGLEESQRLFADKLRRCIDCSTPLTDPISRAERRGPYCRAKQAGRR